jgi:2,4-dienoyl-CoA reductase-like NADH-dependent reductase (Old Yellow Enzyme family)
MEPAETLSKPLRLGPLTTRNRIVMAPLVIWKSDESGTVKQEHLDHYARSAGPGLMMVEATAVLPEGRLSADQLGIWSDDQLAGLTSLAKTIRDTGALAGIQIHHAGGSTNTDRTGGLAPRVPTLLESSPEGAIELTDSEIMTIIDAFAAATRRALAAGFQVIELHGAHSYLISQFLSPETNRRPAPWGGSAENRYRFLVQAITAAREAVAAAGKAGEAVVTVRLGLAASSPRSLSVDEGIEAARAAVAAGADFLDISNGGGVDDKLGAEVQSRAGTTEFAPTFLLASLAKQATGVPVIAVNGIVRPEQAAAALREGYTDLVAVGRAILADPRWAVKAIGHDSRVIEECEQCKPRCFWFKEAHKCPARRKLATRGEQPAFQ